MNDLDELFAAVPKAERPGLDMLMREIFGGIAMPRTPEPDAEADMPESAA